MRMDVLRESLSPLAHAALFERCSRRLFDEVRSFKLAARVPPPLFGST